MSILSIRKKLETTTFPFQYSIAGSLLMAFAMKFHPVHQTLMRFEIHNIYDYFRSGLQQAYKNKPLTKIQAFWLCYFGGIRRVLQLSKKARQDYFAINRQGTYYSKDLPEPAPKDTPSTHPPLLIVPGLNTPPVFFREMHQYFTTKGYDVHVMALPDNGFSTVATASKALGDEIDKLKTIYQTEQVNVVGHCLGGIIGHYYLANDDSSVSIKNMVTLGTGFLGAGGVKILKEAWIERHPSEIIPVVFDELIEWNMTIAAKAGQVAYHNFLTIWDFLVHFKNAVLNSTDDNSVRNYIIEDADIDHLTLALHPKIFQKIELAIQVA